MSACRADGNDYSRGGVGRKAENFASFATRREAAWRRASRPRREAAGEDGPDGGVGPGPLGVDRRVDGGAAREPRRPRGDFRGEGAEEAVQILVGVDRDRLRGERRRDEPAEDRRGGTAHGGRERRLAVGELPFRQVAALRREGEEGFDERTDVPVPEILADLPPAGQGGERLPADRSGLVARVEDKLVERPVHEGLRIPPHRANGGAEVLEGVAFLLEGLVGPIEGPIVREGGIIVGFGGVLGVRLDHFVWVSFPVA